MRYIVITYFVFVSFVCFGQKTPLSTQYMYDKYLMNPAYVGITNNMVISLNAKQNMIGIEGAPTTEFFTIQFPIQAEYMGVGLRFVHDFIGATAQNNAVLTYAYQIGLGEGSLALALEGGIYNYNTNFVGLTVADIEFDPAIPLENTGQLMPDATFAAYYTISNAFFGYSMFHLIEGAVNFPSTSYSGQAVLTKQQHFSAGMQLEIDKGIYFEPMVLGKVTKSLPVQVDVVASLKYKKVGNVGLLYRSGDGLAFMCNVGFKEGLYVLGYSYDFSFSELGAQTKGGHEVSFKYSLELIPPASQKDLNPIYYVD